MQNVIVPRDREHIRRETFVAWWRDAVFAPQRAANAHIFAGESSGHSNEQEGGERFAVGRSLLSAKHTARGYSTAFVPCVLHFSL